MHAQQATANDRAISIRGSISACQRGRGGQYQDATLSEQLNLQGWQLVDEINRAFAGQERSGYTIAVHIVTKANVGADGVARNIFDPRNNDRDQCRSAETLHPQMQLDEAGQET